MPHREVIREESLTTKLRVVFDASSHAQGFPSRNDCLDKGVNLNPELLQVLLRFRRFPVAINSGIEKAFLQIEIQETDRDAFRFLWFHVIPVSQKQQHCRMAHDQGTVWINIKPFLAHGDYSSPLGQRL
ncbi:uncharacterized protein [Dermacentor albipictus]|uniref:uncharacterized protein n=1 Tax=Dermacentor albipictus TaxID=60249 RepID=UPI0038FCE427